MKKIISGLVVASLAGFVFFGCSSEPKSVEEFKKMSKEELDNFTKECRSNKDYEKEAEKYALTQEASKEFLECENAFKAKISRGMEDY